MKFGVEKIGIQAEMVGTGISTVFSRIPISWRGVGAIILGVLLAKWTWILFAPHALTILPPKPDTAENISDALFGIGSISGVAAANVDAVLGNVHLVGVFTGKRGFAVLKLDEKTQRGVAVGEDVVKGTKLVTVNADHVVLEHNGIRQRVNLEKESTNNKGLALEHASSNPGVGQAIAGWNQANQEMQKKQKSFNLHQ